MKSLFFCCCIFLCTVSYAQSAADEQAIRNILDAQTQAWNKGDLEAFMKGYWKSDSLVFIGSKGLTYGYETVLNNYKKGYPTPEKMGELIFNIRQVTRLNDHYFVIGQWTIKRTGGDVSGHFSLIWKKIDGEWKIIADHSS